MPNPQQQQWRFRREGDRDEGVVVSAAEGLQWIEDGVLTGEDEVSPAEKTQWCVLGDHPYWGQQVTEPTVKTTLHNGATDFAN